MSVIDKKISLIAAIVQLAPVRVWSITNIIEDLIDSDKLNKA